jgi:hypothetical protein
MGLPVPPRVWNQVRQPAGCIVVEDKFEGIGAGGSLRLSGCNTRVAAPHDEVTTITVVMYMILRASSEDS